MSRMPYGEEKFFGDIIALVGAGNRLNSPLAALREKTGLCEPTVRKYVGALEERELIAIHENLKSGFLELLSRSFKNGAMIKPAATPVAGPLLVAASKPPTVEKPGMVVLVDFDNTVGVARDSHFVVSFKKLKEVLRTLGRIVFADAFLSATTTNPQTVALLWQAGFQVITCPMGSKDTDAVDSKILWRARQYLRESSIAAAVIVSQDRDFSELVNFAADLGKEAVLFNVGEHKAAIQGTEAEIVIELPRGRLVALFMKAVDLAGNGLSGFNPDDELRVRFVKDLIAAIREKEDEDRRGGRNHPTFHILSGCMQGVLGSRWRQTFREPDFRTALTAMIEKGVITKNANRVSTFYTLNTEHPAVKASLLAPK